MLQFLILLIMLRYIAGHTNHYNGSYLNSHNYIDTSKYTTRAKNMSSNALKKFLHDAPIPKSGPFYDMPSDGLNVTGLVGHTTFLHCRVRNLGNKTVSWVRHRDIHLLTVGRYTYTSDQRFEVIHVPHSEEWSLRIKYPQKKDAGIYECQISTIPPISYPFYLTIEEANTEILGGPDLFIDKGSTINLTCLIEYTPEPPETIIWRHGQKEISFDSPRGGINLVTVKGITTTSRLLVQGARAEDSGEYACVPSNSKIASIRVHILNGELPAAMHHGKGSMSMCSPIISMIVLAITLLIK